jgi:hypothetical protein
VLVNVAVQLAKRGRKLRRDRVGKPGSHGCLLRS